MGEGGGGRVFLVLYETDNTSPSCIGGIGLLPFFLGGGGAEGRGDKNIKCPGIKRL